MTEPPNSPPPPSAATQPSPAVRPTDATTRGWSSVPGIPDYWQHFLLCMGFHLLLPLLPLGLELWQLGQVKATTVTLVAATYAISIGVSSRSRLLFGLSVLISIVFSIAFGLATGGGQTLRGSQALALISIGFIILFHGIERYNRHVAERAPFWQFA